MSGDDTIARMIRTLKPDLKRTLSDSVSSEEAFESPHKRFKALDNSYLGSPREMRRMRADLVHSRNSILSLENRLSHMHKLHEELTIVLETERKANAMQKEYDRKSIETLEEQLQSLRKRELEAKNQLADINDKHAKLKLSTDMKIEELEKKLWDSTSEQKQINEDENSTIGTLNRKINELEFLYNAAKSDAEAQKLLVEELGNKLKEQNSIERNAEQNEVALQKANAQIKKLESELENIKDMELQAKNKYSKLVKYEEIERENNKLKEQIVNLKDQVYNKLLLEEEVHDLKVRLTKFQEQEKKFNTLQITATQNEMYLEEWRAVARGICESNAPDGMLPRLVRNIVEHLQQQEITLLAQKVEAESQLSTALHEAQIAKSEVEKKQNLINDLQNNIQQSQNWIHRYKKKLQLVCRERDSYRNQLDSYEKDLTICINPANTANPGASQLQTQKERISELEKVVDGYRDLINKLDGDLEKAEPLPHSDVSTISSEQLTRYKNEIDQLKNENVMLRKRKDELEIRLENMLVGQDEQKGKIIHLENNPFNEIVAEREQDLEKCQGEIIKLRRKVKDYEDGLEASKLGDVSICPREVQSLKDQLKSSEESIQRLKNYFKSTMQQFRNVIYMLLGYKIDKAGDSQYRLTSMYANKEEDYLCFQLKKDKTLNLMENEFSMSLESLVQLHLHEQKSIPAFLSSLTLNLFNERTMAPDDEEMEEEESEENSESSSSSDNDT